MCATPNRPALQGGAGYAIPMPATPEAGGARSWPGAGTAPPGTSADADPPAVRAGKPASAVSAPLMHVEECATPANFALLPTYLPHECIGTTAAAQAMFRPTVLKGEHGDGAAMCA